MKFTTICLLALLVLAVTAAEKKSKIKITSGEITPQWSCPKVNLENTKAHEDKADGTKCEYLEYIRNVFVSQYQAPTYPSCYAQMDLYCEDKIANYKERSNIRVFSRALEVYCQDGGQWDDFNKLLKVFQDKFPEAFTTEYWQCVNDTATDFETKEYVTFPTWPEPFLGVLNYVCQGVEAQIRNVERQQFQTFFDDNDGFKTLSAIGKDLFVDIQSKINDADLADQLKQCFDAELTYFQASTVPEVEGTYNTKEQGEDDYDQAYLYVDQEDELTGGAPWDEDEEGYECWNYYAPAKHYHGADETKVAEDAFNGNRGHPLCGPNTIYEPLSYYGPICCPIHPIDFDPKTFNCCFESLDLPQQRRRRRRVTPMRKNAACYGCTCLKGFEMDVEGDFWGYGDNYGACIKKEYEDEE